jgi:uncharacterized protein YjbI with pentapeptide repeats
VTAGTRAMPRAHPDDVAAVDRYRAALRRGEYRVLKLPRADLRDVDLSGVQLDECDLSNAILDGARLVGASLVRSNLAEASLVGANFSYADLSRANLEAVDATAAAFANADLTKARLVRSRLQRADLSEADLTRANLFESDLTGANLSRALASQANLHGAILEDSVLTGLRGEPLFDGASNQHSPVIAWPAAKLAEPQLIQLAKTYFRDRGWRISEPSPADDVSIDLMARRGDTLLVLEAKAMATPSSATFTHIAERLRRAVGQHTNVFVFLVIPGPVPESLRALARANQIGVLHVWGELDSPRVEEAVRPPSDSLAS